MRKIIVILFLIMANFGNAQNKYKVLSVHAFKDSISSNVQLLDVRTWLEFKMGSIKKAKQVDYFSSDFKKDVLVFDKEQPIYIYCRSGKRSRKAGKILNDIGFKQVFDLEGGYLNWQKNE